MADEPHTEPHDDSADDHGHDDAHGHDHDDAHDHGDDHSHAEDHGHDADHGGDHSHGDHGEGEHGHDGHGDHGHHHDPLDPAHLMGHIKDAEYFEVPRFIDATLAPAKTIGDDGKVTTQKPDGKIYLPQPLKTKEPIWKLSTGDAQLDQLAGPLDLKLTKYMVIEVVCAVICVVVFVWLAQKIRGGSRPVGRCWNFLETFLVFLRDEVARPAIGKHDADKFLPFLWSMFFFVLGCNLLGMIPWMGSPTGSLATTGALALATFGTVVAAGSIKLGVIGFWKAQVPHMDLPLALAIMLKPMIFAIEILGLVIKHFVLAVRLLANMMAGHMVLAVFVAFVAASAGVATSWFHPLFLGVSVASIVGAILISLLELFVAFLQAYIFTFLSALFIGMAVHPH